MNDETNGKKTKSKPVFNEQDQANHDLFKSEVDRLQEIGWTRKAIAKRAGMSVDGLNQYYGGWRRLGFDAASSYAEVFDMHISKLYCQCAKWFLSAQANELDGIMSELHEENRAELLKAARQIADRQE